MHRFRAPWDRAVTVTTWLTVLLLAGMVLWLPSLGLLATAPEDGLILPLRLVPLLLLLILALAWAYAPRGFAIGEGELRVERPIGPLRLPLVTVTAVGPLAALPRHGTVRTFGASGLFGHLGRFWSPALGHFRLYATRRTGLVVVDAEGGRWVLSPEPPEAFVAALRRAAPRAVDAPAPGPGGARRGADRQVVAGTVAFVVLVLGGLLVAIAGQSPRAARVTDEAVVVERRWFADVAIPLDEVRRAGPLPPALRLGWTRTSGGSLPGGVAWGRFSSPALGGFRVYAWRPGPMVLLETSAGPVVLTPDDPEAFLAAVGARLR